MKQSTKKIVGAIICGAVVILMWTAFLLVFVLVDAISPYFKGILAAVCLALTIVMIALIIERIKEIRSGVEDDLSKY